MKEKPILFSNPMVRAILDGRKTQTRRVVKPQPFLSDTGIWYPSPTPGDSRNRKGLHYASESHMRKGLPIDFCHHGAPGDRLWVRETFRRASYGLPDGIEYKADNSLTYFDDSTPSEVLWKARNLSRYGRWRPSINMPRWASRLTLEVTNVRVERLQEIAEEDAKAEGVEPWLYGHGPIVPSDGNWSHCMYRDGFAQFWESINAKCGYGWKVNPWVWVIEFEALEEREREREANFKRDI